MSQGNGHSPGEFPYIDDGFSELTSPDLGKLENADPDTMLGMVARSAARSERYVKRILSTQSEIIRVVNAHSVTLSSIKRAQHYAIATNAGLVTAVIVLLEVLKRIGILK